MPRTTNPDGVLDADRGSSSYSHKTATYLPSDVADDRARDRAGARELDALVEGTPKMNRASKDTQRAFPVDASTPITSPRRLRELPIPDSVRTVLSSRQCKTRSKTKQAAIRAMTKTQREALDGMVTKSSRWQHLNDALSDAAGDMQQLPDDDGLRVRRVDRAIQAYETRNDREHIVYANVTLPPGASPSRDALSQARSGFRPGQTLEFDRYTGGFHTMHEADAARTGTRDDTDADTDRHRVIFEMRTRRGAYFGRSDSSDDTRHLLPRGMRTRVVSTHEARFIRPDGTSGRQVVVQLEDVTGTSSDSDTGVGSRTNET